MNGEICAWVIHTKGRKQTGKNITGESRRRQRQHNFKKLSRFQRVSKTQAHKVFGSTVQTNRFIMAKAYVDESPHLIKLALSINVYATINLLLLKFLQDALFLGFVCFLGYLAIKNMENPKADKDTPAIL